MFAVGLSERDDTVYHTVPNFSLTTQFGETLVFDSLEGSLRIVDFFFTTCPGVCPKMTNQMQRIQKNFIKDEKVKLISISVDEARDSVAALKAYADVHNAVPGKWFFLRGGKQEVFDLAQKGFFVTASDDEGPEDFLHSEKFILVDWHGQIRGFYNGLDSNSVNKLMGDLVLLLRDTEKGYSFRKDPNKKSSVKDLF